jgi:hypothetical protein
MPRKSKATKAKKPQVKLRDLKAKKDAKGGFQEVDQRYKK